MHRNHNAAVITSTLLLAILIGAWTTTGGVTAQAAPPPYDSDDNKLIDRKLAQVFSGDSDYIKDGRFYDVGRNPDPTGQLPLTDYGDYRFRVTHIKFDLSPDIGPDDVPGEALELQYNHSRTLKHIDEARAKGEWIYKWVTTERHAGRNEPALYVCKEQAKIHVRVECAAPVSSAEIGAKEVDTGAGAQWVDVKPKVVEFQDLPGHVGKVWVSKGPPNDPNNPAAGFSEYVTLDLAAPIKDSINKSECIWQTA